MSSSTSRSARGNVVDTSAVPTSYLQSLNVGAGASTQKKSSSSPQSLSASSVSSSDVEGIAHFFLSACNGQNQTAVALLNAVLEKLGGKVAQGKSSSAAKHFDGFRLFDDEFDSAISTLVLKVPGKPHIIGHVIGKGGSEISKIEAETGSTVKIDSQSKMAPGSCERRICIIGTVSGNMLAQKRVMQKITEKLLLEGVTHDTLKVVVPNKAVRHIIGKGGSNIAKLQNDSGAVIQVAPESQALPSDMGRCIVIQGEESSRSVAQYLISRQVAQDQSIDADWASKDASQASVKQQQSAWAAQDHLHAILEDGSKGGSQKHQYSQNNHHGGSGGKQNMESAQITVPNSSVAYLIGRGGAAISDMQKQSRARINIAKQSSQAEITKRRQVTITGTPQAIQLAQMIIARKLQQYEQGSSSNNNNNFMTAPSPPRSPAASARRAHVADAQLAEGVPSSSAFARDNNSTPPSYQIPGYQPMGMQYIPRHDRVGVPQTQNREHENNSPPSGANMFQNVLGSDPWIDSFSFPAEEDARLRHNSRNPGEQQPFPSISSPWNFSALPGNLH